MRALLTPLAVAALLAGCSVYPVAQDPNGLELRRNANQVMMAIQSWHRDRGTFPMQLAELVPAYLPALPDAPALRYGRSDGSLSFHYVPNWPQLRPVWCSSVGDTTNWRCEEHTL